MDTPQLVLAALSGGLVALLLTVFGGGGSVLAVPLLLYVVGVRDPHVAIGVSAAGVSLNALTALAGQARKLHAALTADPSAQPADVAVTLTTRRSSFDHRAVVIGSGRAELLAGLDALVHEIAAEERVQATVDVIWSIDPIAFHPDLVDLAADVVEARSGLRHVMPSGPMHDSAEMARAGIPTVMMFVPSINGLSHTHVEDTAFADIELGVIAFDDLVRRILGWAPDRLT